MKLKHIAKAIGVLSALAEEHYDKDGDCDGQTTEWHDLRSALHVLHSSIEEAANKEVSDGTA